MSVFPVMFKKSLFLYAWVYIFCWFLVHLLLGWGGVLARQQQEVSVNYTCLYMSFKIHSYVVLTLERHNNYLMSILS